MRPWVIVLVSAAAGIVAAAALIWPEAAAAPPADLAASLPELLPAPTVAFLAVYALAALLLTTGTLIGGLLRLRRRLAEMIAYRGPARVDWAAALTASGLQLPRPTTLGNDAAALPLRLLDPERVRSEVARVNYLGLARAHFFSALVGLAAIVALGLAQDHARFPLLPQPIPTISTVLIVFGLILTALLARLAVDVAAEPVAETLSRVPAERPEAALLHRAIELLEAVRLAAATRAEDALPAPMLPDRLVEAIEDGHRALIEAVGRMSAAAEALGATTRSSVETLEASLRASQARLATDEPVHADAAGLGELRGAVEGLTALLERLAAPPRAGPAAATAVLPEAPAAMPQPQLARELRRLLQEIDAEP
jgi:hypothetical protein